MNGSARLNAKHNRWLKALGTDEKQGYYMRVLKSREIRCIK